MTKCKASVLIVFLCILGCSSHVKDGVYKEYYQTGTLKTVKSYDHGALNGISREYFESGTLKHAVSYKNDKVDGIFHTYYPSGALWTNETYESGTLVSRSEYNEEGEVISKENFDRD